MDKSQIEYKLCGSYGSKFLNCGDQLFIQRLDSNMC